MKSLSCFVLASFFILSCSLNYGDTDNSEQSVPEIVFDGAKFNRIKNNEITFKMQAERIEQYKEEEASYSKNVSFATYEDSGIAAEGSCGLLFIDSGKNIYTLFDGITILDHKNDMAISAESLHWNKDTEQLVGGKYETVCIKKKAGESDTMISGSGFSANTASNSFAFLDAAKGSIIKTENQ